MTWWRARARGIALRVAAALWRALNEPWVAAPDRLLDLRSPSLRRLIARALWNERRERGGMVAWSYSRDRIVERRELRCEPDWKKRVRLLEAIRDKATRGAGRGTRLIA